MWGLDRLRRPLYLPRMLFILQSGRTLAIGIFWVWALVSVLSLALGWAEIFAAMGSLLLSLAVAVFLTERYRANERRRLWDHDLQAQLGLLAEIANRAHGNAAPSTREPLHDIQQDLHDSVERMTVAKAREQDDETWRDEVFLSITGTLQWGFGALLVDLIH